MEISEIKQLKEEMETILPNHLIEATKEIGDALALSLDNSKRLLGNIPTLIEKINQVKKGIEVEIGELMATRAETISENNRVYNERADKIKAFDATILEKENTVSSLESTINDLSFKINGVQKNIESLVSEKNTISQDVSKVNHHISQLREEEKEVQNNITYFEQKKSEANKQLEDVQVELDKTTSILQLRNNEILIAEEKLKELRK